MTAARGPVGGLGGEIVATDATPEAIEAEAPLLLPPREPGGRFRTWMLATLGVLLAATFAAGWLTWRFVEPRYSAISYCRTFGPVAWDLDESNWRTCGTTEVNFNAFVRPSMRFPMGLPSTRNMFVSYDVSDEVLAHLAELPPVHKLDLTNVTTIRGPRLAVLSRLPDLRELTINRAYWTNLLRGPIVRDETLRQIAAGPKLRVLHINGARVTDEGLAAIGPFAMLEDLDLSWTNVGDAGLAHLKGLTGLKKLDLTATRVTDAGLMNLRGLADLKLLILHRTGVTPAGVGALQAALPGLEYVDHGGMVGRDFDRKDTSP